MAFSRISTRQSAKSFAWTAFFVVFGNCSDGDPIKETEARRQK
jgi:hypothetical protein